MNLSSAFGVIGVLYAVFTIVLAGVAVYAVVPVTVFLRLRITELKRAARPPTGDGLGTLMMQTKRPAPDTEWVLMDGGGLPTSKIAAGNGAAETTVRYHRAIAVRFDPRIRAEHQAARPVPASG